MPPKKKKEDEEQPEKDNRGKQRAAKSLAATRKLE